MERFAQSVQCVFQGSLRPQQLEHLIAMELVPWLNREEFDQSRGVTPLPGCRLDQAAIHAHLEAPQQQ